MNRPFGEFHGTQEPSVRPHVSEWSARCAFAGGRSTAYMEASPASQHLCPTGSFQRNHMVTSIVCSSYVSAMLGIVCDHSPVYLLRQRVSVEPRAQQMYSLSGLLALEILCLCLLRLELQVGGHTSLVCMWVGRSERQSSCLHCKNFNAEPSTQLHQFLLNFLSSRINYTQQLASP